MKCVATYLDTKKDEIITCSSELDKVMYMGIPMYLCSNDECRTVYGFLSVLVFPLSWLGLFDGVFIAYEGSYFKALLSFIKGDFK